MTFLQLSPHALDSSYMGWLWSCLLTKRLNNRKKSTIIIFWITIALNLTNSRAYISEMMVCSKHSTTSETANMTPFFFSNLFCERISGPFHIFLRRWYSYKGEASQFLKYRCFWSNHNGRRLIQGIVHLVRSGIKLHFCLFARLFSRIKALGSTVSPLRLFCHPVWVMWNFLFASWTVFTK